MTISPLARLFLYNIMAALPVWVDWMKNSADWSLRGLLIPTLNSLYAMAVVTLAKTAPTNDDEPQKVKVINKPADPVPTTAQLDKGSKKTTAKP